MDLAIVLDLRQQQGRSPGLLERPFGETDLAELALAKLEGLDAPVRRLVLAPGAEERARVRARPGLQALRRAGERCDLARPATSLAGLERLEERFVLWLNPLHPLVAAEDWWAAVERHHAEGADGLVAAGRLRGPFFSPTSFEIGAEDELLQTSEAFFVFSPRTLARRGRLFARAPLVHELDPDAARGIRTAADMAAVEALWLRRRLALPV